MQSKNKCTHHSHHGNDPGLKIIVYLVILSRYNYLMGKYIKRLLNIDTGYSSFLWGARQTGKSSWIKHNFGPGEIILIDMLQTDVLVLGFLHGRVQKQDVLRWLISFIYSMSASPIIFQEDSQNREHLNSEKLLSILF